MTASYQVKSGEVVSIGSVYPNGSEENDTFLNFENATIDGLTKANNCVDFIFTFTNSGPTAYTAVIEVPTSNQFTITYSTALDAEPTGSNPVKVTVNANTTSAVTYKVRYEINDVSKNAEISGNFNWTLEAIEADA